MRNKSLVLFCLFALWSCGASRSKNQTAHSLSADATPMVSIAAGSFEMGDNYGEYDESPEHSVVLDGFQIDKYEVSNAQYSRCVDADACVESDLADDAVLGAGDHPVVGVHGGDAKAYCAFVGKRLPTEAEWEKAARGLNKNKWPWGHQTPDGNANLNGNKDGYEKTAPVTAFAEGQSVYGVLNLGGNVAEWISDTYDPAYYRNSPKENPHNQSGNGAQAVRGGSYNSSAYEARAANRDAQHPSFRSDVIGFRCAKNGIQ